jgi:hypothetical protein
MAVAAELKLAFVFDKDKNAFVAKTPKGRAIFRMEGDDHPYAAKVGEAIVFAWNNQPTVDPLNREVLAWVNRK